MPKIIFNNETEKQWWKELMDKFLSGDDIRCPVESYNKWADEECPEDRIWDAQADFWEQFFYESKIEIDPSINPTYLNDENLISGTCSACGCTFQGLESHDLTVEYYTRLEANGEPDICSDCYHTQSN